RPWRTSARASCSRSSSPPAIARRRSGWCGSWPPSCSPTPRSRTGASSASRTEAARATRNTPSSARPEAPVPVDPALLRTQCARTLARTDFPALGERIEGKVRDSYVADGRRVLIATDRVSAFDVVLGTIPFKGQVLNQIAAFWFERTREVAPNHVISVPDPNVTIGRECRPVPLEFVVRGHLTGVTDTSIWTAYS